MKDIKIMIDYFVEEERYEDCALLVGIKEDVMDYYDKQTEKLLKNTSTLARTATRPFLRTVFILKIIWRGVWFSERLHRPALQLRLWEKKWLEP